MDKLVNIGRDEYITKQELKCYIGNKKFDLYRNIEELEEELASARDKLVLSEGIQAISTPEWIEYWRAVKDKINTMRGSLEFINELEEEILCAYCDGNKEVFRNIATTNTLAIEKVLDLLADKHIEQM